MGNNNTSVPQHPLDSGKAVSQDQLFSLPKRNGYLRNPMSRLQGSFSLSASKQDYYSKLPSSLDPLMTSSFSTSPCSSPAYQPRDPQDTPPPIPYRAMNGNAGSGSTLDESGISSKGSTLEESFVGGYTLSFSTTSAPSTPHNMLRQKPPPKPPRMRNFNTPDTPNGPPQNGMSPTPTKRSVSSLADVTSSFDAVTMVSHNLDNTLTIKSADDPPTPRSPRLPKVVPSVARDKVYNVLAQTKEFLSHEIEPEYVLEYLRRKGVISSKTELEIRRCRTRHGMSEFLLDIITSKGQEEFVIFCDALRTMGKQGYVADFLQVLDSLVELVTSNGKNSIRFIRQTARNGEATVNGVSEEPECPKCNSSSALFMEDIFNEGTTFDIDISYMDVDTGQTKLFKDIQNLKRLRRPHSITGAIDSSVKIREEADRYVPVISVSLYNQCLCNNRINTLAGLLENYSCVKELSIAKNHIGTEGIIRLGKALEKNRGLVKLDIRLNTIGDEGAFHLAKGLKRHLSLLMLNVTSTGLTGSGCGILMQGLGRNQSLIELDIGFNELDEKGCQAVADALASNCTLRKLRMRDNSLPPYGAKCIFKALKRNSRLGLLDISSNRIGNESIQMLGDVLRFNRTLRELNLEKCNISREGCLALARAFKINTTLKSLDLSLNPIGDDGVEAIADGLKYNQIMDMLCLNMCDIGNRGFLSLLDAMRFNSTMTSLKLCYNNIGLSEEGCGGGDDSTGSGDRCPVEELYEKLCQVLQSNKDLKVLLWGNKFDDPLPEDHVAASLDLAELDPVSNSTTEATNGYVDSRPPPPTFTLAGGSNMLARRQSTV